MRKWNILSVDSIINCLRPSADQATLETYFSKISDTLTSISSQLDSSYLSLTAFEDYMNMPLIITNRLYHVGLAKGGSDQLLKEAFILTMLNCYFSKGIEVITHFTFEFMDCYNNKLIQSEDVRLLLYFFHSMTNKSAISQIDVILSKCLVNDKEISYDEYKASLKTNADLMFLLLFYFRQYRPFDKEILDYCKKHQCDNSNIVSELNCFITTKEKETIDCFIAKPSNDLIDYLKNEFGFDLLEYCRLHQSQTIFQTEQAHEQEESRINQYVFTKHHLIIVSNNFKIYPLVNSYMESSSSIKDKSNQIINVYRLNSDLKPLHIKANLNEDLIQFTNLYYQYNPIRNIDDFYTQYQTISQGNFSTVKIALRKSNSPNEENTPGSNKPFIVKIITKSIPCGYKWEKDISKLLMNNTHPNVMSCIDMFETNTTLYLIFEYYYDGSLLDYLMNCYEKLSANEISVIISQLLSGLEFLQKFGIVHRDIKPENILVAQPFYVKINDIGLSKVMFSKEKAQESFGSLCYASPEIILHKWYSHKTDLWSIGVISYFLQFAELPFNEEDETKEEFNNIAKKIIKCDYNLPNDEETIVNKCTLAYKAIKLFLIVENKRVNLKDFMVKYVDIIKGNCSMK